MPIYSIVRYDADNGYPIDEELFGARDDTDAVEIWNRDYNNYPTHTFERIDGMDMNPDRNLMIRRRIAREPIGVKADGE